MHALATALVKVLRAAVLLPLLAGCYNADALLHQHSEADAVLRMEEIDLGEFSITLPHVLGQATDYLVDFHVFGYVKSGDREKVTHALALRGPELRSHMLMKVRSLHDADFDEPKLSKLRESVAEVINGALKEQVVQRVGFYHYSFSSYN
jgi:hypothetical protein